MKQEATEKMCQGGVGGFFCLEDVSGAQKVFCPPEELGTTAVATSAWGATNLSKEKSSKHTELVNCGLVWVLVWVPRSKELSPFLKKRAASM